MVAGLAPHVHEHDAGPGLGDHPGHVGVAPQRGDVVDDRRLPWRGPARQPPPCEVSIETGERSSSAAQLLDDRQHPPQFLVQRHGLRSGPGGFASQVEQVGPVVDQGPRMLGSRGPA